MANEFKVKNGLIVIGDLTTSGTITINGALAATQSWVSSQAYLTSSSLTSYATQSYVTSAIASLVDSAPGALDTLRELATALGNDASFSTTVTNSIAAKLPLAGGTLTGALTGTSATFSDQLIASSTSGGTAAIFRNTGGQNSNGFELRGGTTGSTVNWKFEKDNTVSNAFQLTPSTTNGGTTYTTPVLTIASTGAATFSNSVTNTSGMLLNVGATGGNGNMNYTTFANGVYSALNSATPTEGIGMWADNQGNASIGALYNNTASSLNLVVRASSSVSGLIALKLAGTGAATFSTGSEAVITWARTSCKNWALASDSAGAYFKNTTDSVIPIYMTNGGNVGIGTTAPGRQLELAGPTDAYIQLTRNNTGVQATLGFNTGVTNDWLIRTDDASANLRFYSYGISDYALTLARDTGAATFKSTIASGGNINVGSQLTFTPTEARIISGSSTIAINNNANNTNLLLINNSTGNVGIGTSSPTQKLEVGNFLDAVTNRITVASRYEYEPEFNFRLGQSGTNYDWVGAVISSGDDGNYNGKILFKTAVANREAPTTKMAIKANGNVGIGTVSPSEKLDVLGNIKIYNETGLITDYGPLIGRYNTSQIYIGTGGSYSIIKIGRDDGSALNVLSGGTIGIGTTSPGAKLHVVGTESRFGGVASGFISVYNANSRSGYFQANEGSDFRIASDINDMTFYVSGSERVRFASGGNVGIGTTSPSEKLSVNGFSYAYGAQNVSGFKYENTTAGHVVIMNANDSYAQIYTVGATPLMLGTNNTSRVYITSGGDVGIGITSPSTPLHIAKNSTYNNVSTAAFRIANITSPNKGIDFGYDNTADVGFIQGIEFGVQAKNLTLQSDGGNVGIGTTSPGAKLTVYSDTTTDGIVIDVLSKPRITLRDRGNSDTIIGTGDYGLDDFFIDTYSGNALAIKGSTRNVGIGTSSPNEKLHVAGNINAYVNGGIDAGLFASTSAGSTTIALRSNGITHFNGGSVGIGTFSPTDSLSVQGNTNLGNSYGSTTSSTYTTRVSGYAMRYDASNRYGNYGVLILNADSGWTGSARRFMITNGLNVNKFAIIRSVDSTTDPSFGDGGAISSGTADFVIDSAGNVGIGTTTPGYKLDISGNSRTTGIHYVDTYLVTPYIYGGGPITMGNDVIIDSTSAWNASAAMLNVGGTGDGRIQVRHIYGKSDASAAVDHLWLQYQNTGKHVQIGADSEGNNLYVSGNIYMNGYFGGNLVATQSWVNSQGFLTSVSDIWVNTTGDTMTGSLSFSEASVIKKRFTTGTNNPVKTASGVLTSRSDNGGGSTYYIIETNVPQDDYQMGGFTIEIFGNYSSTNHKTKIDLGGYWNPESNGGFEGFEAHGSNPQYKPTIEVARNTSGKTVFIIYGVSWNYPVIVARDLWLGYTGSDGGTYGEGWSIIGTSDISSYVNRDTVVWRNAYSDSNPAGYITGYTETDTLQSVTSRGASTNTGLYINNNNPTLYLQDTDHRSAMIHVNSDYFYILNGAGTNSTGWAQQANSRWLFMGNLNNNDITFGGSGDFAGTVTASGGNSSNWNTAYGWGNHASYSYATTSYVTTQINNLIAGAPGVLDTLDELAAALGDDANFATTVTNSIATKLPLAGGTMSGTISFVNNIGTALQGTVGDNDFWRIYANSTSSNAGYLEIATSDDGTEPIYVRQYTGVFSSLTRTATLLDGAGNTSFPGNLTVGGTITESSSIKLKENVETSEGNLEKVVNLRPVTYNKIGSQTTELGLIAEEVATVYPEFVQYDESGEPVGVNYSRLTAALIGAVKELTQRIETLENNG